MQNKLYHQLIYPALFYGGITGGVIIIHSVVLQALGASYSGYAKISGVILPVILFYYCLYNYRKNYHGGLISYRKGLGMGVMISIVYAIIAVAFLIILVKYSKMDYVQMVRQIMEEQMLKKGLDEDLIEQAMEMTEKFRTLGFMTITRFFGSIINGTFYSAIIMIFLKNEPKDPFASVEP